MNPLPMVMADLRAMRWIALAVSLLVALSVASAVAISAQERMLRGGSARAADDFDLMIGAAGSETQLILTGVYLDLTALNLVDGAILNGLARDPRVRAAAPIAFGDVVSGYPVIGTTAEFASRWGRLSPVEGRLFAAEGEAVIGADVRFPVGERLVPSHGTSANGNDEEARHRHEGAAYTIVGRLPRTGTPYDRAILIPVESVWETHGLGNGHAAEGRIGPPFDAETVPGVPAIVVKPRGVADAYSLRAAYRRGSTMAVFPAEILVSLYARLGDLRDILVLAAWLNTGLIFAALFCLVVVLTGFRRKRYAVLRALGAPARYILAVVWIGAALLVGAGCVVGLGLGWAVAVVVARLVEARTGVALVFQPAWSDLWLVASLFGLGGLVALAPALIAYRAPPGAALRA
jgi:putative ABC transport system permease protein